MLRLREQSCRLAVAPSWSLALPNSLLFCYAGFLVSWFLPLITHYYLVQYLSVRNWGPDLAEWVAEGPAALKFESLEFNCLPWIKILILSPTV